MSQDIQIYDRSSRKYVPAELHETLAAEEFTRVEELWRPLRQAAVDRLCASGKTLEEARAIIPHFRWDWQKIRSLVQGLLNTVFWNQGVWTVARSGEG